MSLKHLIAAMLTPVSYLFLPVPFAAASTPSDSVAVQPHLPRIRWNRNCRLQRCTPASSPTDW